MQCNQLISFIWYKPVDHIQLLFQWRLLLLDVEVFSEKLKLYSC